MSQITSTHPSMRRTGVRWLILLGLLSVPACNLGPIEDLPSVGLSTEGSAGLTSEGDAPQSGIALGTPGELESGRQGTETPLADDDDDSAMGIDGAAGAGGSNSGMNSIR